MKIRIYQCLPAAVQVLSTSGVASDAQLLFDAAARSSLKDLLKLWHLLLCALPSAQMKREHGFRSDPAIYLSWLLTVSEDFNQVKTSLDQLVDDGSIGAWENIEQVKYPSLSWLLDQQPRTKILPNLQSLLFPRQFGTFHLRIFAEELPTLNLRGINASTGQRFFSQTEEAYHVVTLDFTLDLGEKLLLWCAQGSEKNAPIVATAMLWQMGRLRVERAEGIAIREDLYTGFSFSP